MYIFVIIFLFTIPHISFKKETILKWQDANVEYFDFESGILAP